MKKISASKIICDGLNVKRFKTYLSCCQNYYRSYWKTLEGSSFSQNVCSLFSKFSVNWCILKSWSLYSENLSRSDHWTNKLYLSHFETWLILTLMPKAFSCHHSSLSLSGFESSRCLSLSPFPAPIMDSVHRLSACLVLGGERGPSHARHHLSRDTALSVCPCGAPL